MRNISHFLPLAAMAVTSSFHSVQTTFAQEHQVNQQNIQRVIQLQTSTAPLAMPNTSPSQSSRVDRTQPNAARPELPNQQTNTGGSSPAVAVPAVLQSDDGIPWAPNVAPHVSENSAKQFAQIPTVQNKLASQQPVAHVASVQPSAPASRPLVQSNLKQTPVHSANPVPRNVEDETAPAQTPVSISKTGPSINTHIEAPSYINLNQTVTLKLQLKNVGQTTAGKVKLIATLPAHAKFSQSVPAPTNSHGLVYEFEINDIGSEQIREIRLDLIPTEKLPLDIGTEVVVENVQRIAVGVRQPKLTIDIVGPQSAALGERLKYDVKLTNTGDGVAEDVTLKSIFPDQVQPVKSTGEIVIDDVQPGRSVVVDFETIAKLAGPAELKFLITGKGIQPENATAKLIVYQPELNATVAGPGMNFVNREGIYTIKLDNTGKVKITNAKIQLNIPQGMKVTTISREAEIDQENGVLVWNFDSLAAESSESIMLKMAGQSAGHQVCNIDVRSDQTTEKRLQLATQMATRADLNVAIINQSGPVAVGEKAQFLVLVENSGSSAASNISINIELPDSLRPAQHEGGQAVEAGNSISFQNAELEPGQTQEFVFTAIVSQKGQHVVRSTLQTAGSEHRMITEGSVFAYEINEARVSEALGPAIQR